MLASAGGRRFCLLFGVSGGGGREGRAGPDMIQASLHFVFLPLPDSSNPLLVPLLSAEQELVERAEGETRS